MLSRKQAARRPRPPLPNAASCSCVMTSSMRKPRSLRPSETRQNEFCAQLDAFLPVATSFSPTLSIALSRALPIRNSRDRSSIHDQYQRYPQRGDLPNNLLTVDTLLIGKGLALLRLVPINDEPIPERQGCSGIGRPGKVSVELFMAQRKFVQITYNSSQLNNDRASVVSMCLTASFYFSSAYPLDFFPSKYVCRASSPQCPSLPTRCHSRSVSRVSGSLLSMADSPRIRPWMRILGHSASCQPALPTEPSPLRSFRSLARNRLGVTNKFSPSFPLAFWDACFNIRDLSRTEAGDSTLVLWAREVRPHGSLEV